MQLYYLSTCDTCRRIMKDLQTEKYPFRLQDIKKEQITTQQLEEMAELVKHNLPDLSPYEALFSKVAMKYRSLGLNKMDLAEDDFKKYILQEYTFLKRPVFTMGSQIFIGNAASTIEKAKKALESI